MKETTASGKAASSTVTAPSAATTAQRIPVQRGGASLEHAVRYATERSWEVLPGAWLETVRGVPRCSCAEARCDAPGAHPLGGDWRRQVLGSATEVRRRWERQPTASVLLPTGRSFDAIEVPEIAGCLALARMERMALARGPVVCTPYGRMLFFVGTGAARRLPELVRAQGWSPGAIDMQTHGEGSWVAAPPTRVGRRGSVQWVRQPYAANRPLPSVEEVIPQLAYACGQEAVSARAS